jgi:hypothetical protein
MSKAFKQVKNTPVSKETQNYDKDSTINKYLEQTDNDCIYLSSVIETGKQNNLFEKKPYNVLEVLDFQST